MAASAVTTLTCVVAVFVVMHWSGGALAQSGCTSSLVSLSPCLNYVSGNSSRPSSSCCSQLSSVVKSQPRCLCVLLNGGSSSLGVEVNQTLALALPDACKVQTPPASRCNAPGNGPTTAPPADSSNQKPAAPTTPSISDIPAGSGSKTVPTIDGSSSAGGNLRASFQLLSFLFFVAYYALSQF